MADIIADPLLNMLVIGIGAFLASFIILEILWRTLVRIIETVLSKTRFYFLPRIMVSLSFPVTMVFIIVSFYFGILFADEALLDNVIFKVWSVLLIFAILNVILKLIFSSMDIYYEKKKKSKDRWGFYRRIPLIKSAIGFLLYGLIIILSVAILSYEVGMIILVVAIALMVLSFIALFDQIKDIVAGFQLSSIEEGDLIKVKDKIGFVERVGGRSTTLRTLRGNLIKIPNHIFFKEGMERVGVENNILSSYVTVKGKDAPKIKEKISSLTGKVALSMDDIPEGFKPKVFMAGVEEGNYIFLLNFKVATEADVRKIMDGFCSELTGYFKDKVIEISEPF